MRQILVFLIFILNMCCSSLLSQNDIDSLGRRQGFWSIAISDSTFMQGRFVNDTLDGVVYLSPIDKEVFTSQLTYRMGVLDGVSSSYYGSGNYRELREYRFGKMMYQLKFRQNGTIQEEVNYNTDGVREGYHRLYFKNGRINVERKYENGKLSGREITYKKNGKIRLIIEYREGVVISTSR